MENIITWETGCRSCKCRCHVQTCEEQIYCLIGSCGENIKRSWTKWLDKLSPYAINFLAVGASWELSAATAHQLAGLARERESFFIIFGQTARGYGKHGLCRENLGLKRSRPVSKATKCCRWPWASKASPGRSLHFYRD